MYAYMESFTQISFKTLQKIPTSSSCRFKPFAMKESENIQETTCATFNFERSSNKIQNPLKLTGKRSVRLTNVSDKLVPRVASKHVILAIEGTKRIFLF